MIFGNRVRLRAIERTDLPYFVSWLNDPEVRQFISIYLPLSQVAEENWFEKVQKHPVEEQPLAIEVRSGDTWRLIGNLALFDINWRVRSAELGILIGDKTFWNQGYGSEALGVLLRHAFQTLNLNRVYLRVFADNQRAIRSYERTGFIHEGRQRSAEFRDGVYSDILMMSILCAEWQARPE
jgi:RimJ/RimL family protein N-acetyltransferase